MEGEPRQGGGEQRQERVEGEPGQERVEGEPGQERVEENHVRVEENQVRRGWRRTMSGWRRTTSGEGGEPCQGGGEPRQERVEENHVRRGGRLRSVYTSSGDGSVSSLHLRGGVDYIQTGGRQGLSPLSLPSDGGDREDTLRTVGGETGTGKRRDCYREERLLQGG